MRRDYSRRSTKQRQIILDVLKKMKNHPTADEIYEAVRHHLPRISLGTVYRNLQILSRSGMIRTLTDGERMRFDSSLHEHYHIRCLACGRVDDMPESALRELGEKIVGESNYKILGFKMEFVGICPACLIQGKEVSIEDETRGEFNLLKDK